MNGFRWVPVALLVAAFGCAAGGASSGASLDGPITRDQLEGLAATDAMEAVELLRPRWLRARPMRTPGDMDPSPRVVIDGRPQQTLNDLALIPLSSVETITFLSAADATTRYGLNHTGGAIVVVTRRR